MPGLQRHLGSPGTDSYLDMLYPRLQLMKRLLAEGKRKRTIAVRVVDIFGNDAGATVDLQS